MKKALDISRILCSDITITIGNVPKKTNRRGGKKWRKKAPDKLETARVVLEMLAYIATVASLVWQIVKG